MYVHYLTQQSVCPSIHMLQHIHSTLFARKTLKRNMNRLTVNWCIIKRLWTSLRSQGSHEAHCDLMQYSKMQAYYNMMY